MPCIPAHRDRQRHLLHRLPLFDVALAAGDRRADQNEARRPPGSRPPIERINDCWKPSANGEVRRRSPSPQNRGVDRSLCICSISAHFGRCGPGFALSGLPARRRGSNGNPDSPEMDKSWLSILPSRSNHTSRPNIFHAECSRTHCFPTFALVLESDPWRPRVLTPSSHYGGRETPKGISSTCPGSCAFRSGQ